VSRKFGTVPDFDGYLNWTQNPVNVTTNGASAVNDQRGQATSPVVHADPPQTSGPMGNAPPPASFAALCEMIAEGKPIPGIKDIPDTVLEGQATQSQAVQRKKPWEKDAAPAPTPVWARAG